MGAPGCPTPTKKGYKNRTTASTNATAGCTTSATERRGDDLRLHP